MAPGYGVSDGAALHFVGTELHEVVASQPQAQAWHVSLGRRGKVAERSLAVRYLGEEAPRAPALVGEQLAA
jgi:dipeptidase E